MFCPQCGKEITNPNYTFCPQCGKMIGVSNTGNANNNARVQQPGNQGDVNVNIVNVNNDDTGSIGWGILGFFIPLVGLILFLVWKNDKPRNAKSAGVGALISVCITVLLYIFGFIIGYSLM